MLSLHVWIHERIRHFEKTWSPVIWLQHFRPRIAKRFQSSTRCSTGTKQFGQHKLEPTASTCPIMGQEKCRLICLGISSKFQICGVADEKTWKFIALLCCKGPRNIFGNHLPCEHWPLHFGQQKIETN